MFLQCFSNLKLENVINPTALYEAKTYQKLERTDDYIFFTSVQLLFRDRHIRMHGAHLTHEFYLKQCHFHWGESEFEPGSEHWIDGQQFDAEARNYQK